MSCSDSKLQEMFKKYWIDYIDESSMLLKKSEKEIFEKIVIDVFVTINNLVNELYNKNITIKPNSNFYDDLEFTYDDYDILRGRFKFEYIPSGFKEFHNLKTVDKCIWYTYKQYINR